MTVPQLMQQVQLHAYGGPEALQVAEVAIPQPLAGQILIKVEAVGVNYADVLRRRNRYFMPTPLPYVLGAEAAGKIVATGEGVNGAFQEGVSVLAILPYGGGYSTYLVADAQYCVPLPPHIPAAKATALFVQGCTAHALLHHVAQDVAGKSVLIHAASGGVGSLLVQLANSAGAARVIGTGSSGAKLAAISDFGASAAIDYTLPGWTDAVIAANAGKGVDFIFEMVGGDIYRQSFDCLAQGGTMVVYGAASGQKGLIHSEHFVDESHNLLSFNLAHYIQYHPEKWQQTLGAVIGLVAGGQLHVSVANSYPLDQAAIAHRDLEQRKTTGKVVLLP